MRGKHVGGKYRLTRLLGEGSMGAVYQGVHVDLGKRVAIKLVRAELANSPEVVVRFRREAWGASAVESDYNALIYDFGRDETLGLYMVIEYLEGEDLETRLSREKWISASEAATIGLQVARALAKAHAAGIIHRDLKPANIFLTQRDDGSMRAKLLDFGISKLDRLPGRGDEEPEPTITALGTALGTPLYMSPEQCQGKVALDGRTDVWALCAVLYEMLAGESAIEERRSPIETMMRIVHQDVKALSSRASWVPEKLGRVVDAGLARDREERIPNASALAARLVEVIPEVGNQSPSQRIERATDVSELHFDDEPEAIPAPPPALHVAKLDSARTFDSTIPPSSGDQRVQMFVRAKDVLTELAALHTKKE